MVAFAIMMSSSYTMLIPFLPIYLVRELGATESNVNLWSGVIFAISFAISAVVSPLWGKLSDKTGRKPMILRASILLALTYFLGGLVHSPLQLFMVRVLQGFASGLWPACLAMLSAYVPKNKLGIAMGLMQSANICGGILGPLIGGLLATGFGMRNSFFIAASLLSTITLITVFFLKEPPKEKNANGTAPQRVTNTSLIKNRSILTLLLAAGLTNMVILQLQPIMTLYVGTLEGTNADNLVLISGIVFSLSGIAGAIAAPFWGKTGQRVGFYKTMIIGFISAGFIIASQSIPDSLMVFAILQFVSGLGFSGIFPSANSILILITPPNARGAGFGLFFAAQQVGGAIGPILGGIIATLMPLNSVFVASGVILLLIGITVLVAAPEGIKVRTGSKEIPENIARQDYIEKIKQEAIAEMKQKQAKASHKKTADEEITDLMNRHMPTSNRDDLPYI